jgi:hypothetical protein
MTWFIPFWGPIAAIILLLIFGPCLLYLVVKSVSSHLERFKLQMLMEIKIACCHSSLDSPHHGWP